MPFYDYKCQKCETIHELMHPIKGPIPTECPDEECKGELKRGYYKAPTNELPLAGAASRIDRMNVSVRENARRGGPA